MFIIIKDLKFALIISLSILTRLSLHADSNMITRTITTVPLNMNLSSFYSKSIQADITLITAHDVVSDQALINMANVIETLLSKIKADHPSVYQALKMNNHRFSIIGRNQNTVELPEYSHLSKKNFGWTRGLGGTLHCPLSSCGEENALHLGKPEDRYGEENIGVHEFAHGIYNIGIKAGAPELFTRIIETYKAARKKGLWDKTYGGSNADEYFSICTQCWFSVMVPTSDGKPNGVKNHVYSRETLKAYDPDMYAIMQSLYPATSLPAPWERTFEP